MLKKDQPIFVSEKMFTMTEEDYNKESVANKLVFDQQAVALCVMLRKEFGEAKLQGFLRIGSKNNSQDVLRVVYGFSGYGHFDKQYIRFMRDLTSDVLNNKTPDSYLEIRPVR
jgi:cellobiose phosphorylase